MDPLTIHVKLSESQEDLIPTEEQGNEVSSNPPVAGKDGDPTTCGILSDQRTASHAMRAGSVPPLVTYIRIFSEPIPDDGALHLANQPNLITMATVDQPEPLDVILSIAASPTCSAIVPLPSDSMEEEDCEIDTTDCVCQGVEKVPLEEPTVVEEAQEEPVMEERADADNESAPIEQPKKKRIKRKDNRAPQPESAPKKKKVASSPVASKPKKTKAPLMGQERRAVIPQLGLPIDFHIPAFVERSIIALGFKDASIGLEVIHPQLVMDFYEGEWTSDDGPVVTLHGFAPIDPKSINEVFTLPDEAFLGDRIISSPSKEDLPDALKELCIENTQWTFSASGARTTLSP